MSRWKKRYGPLGKEWAKLGLRIISDRRLCLGGRILDDVVFPKNEALQVIVMKKLLVWYLDCFDLRAPKTSAGFYKLNNACFRQRQSVLQRIFRRLSGKPPLVGIGRKYFFMPLTNTWTQETQARKGRCFKYIKVIFLHTLFKKRMILLVRYKMTETQKSYLIG